MYKPYLYDRTPSLPTFVKVRWGGLAQAIDFYADFTRGLYWIRGVGIVSVGQFISLAGSGTEYAVNSSGVLEAFATTVPAIQSGMGFQIFEGRTNLVLQSQTFDNASWTKGATTVSADATTAPDGTSTADKIVEASGTSVHEIYRAYTVTAAAYTWSVYAKAGERTWIWINAAEGGTAKMTYFNLATGAVGTNAAGSTASIQALGDGWYRCVVTRTMVGTSSYMDVGLASADNTSSYAGDTSKGAYLWGAQLELGSFASPYIPTTTGSAARGARVPSIIGQAANVFLGAKSIYAQTNAIAGGSSSRVVEWSGGAQNLSINPTTTVRTSNAANDADATLGSGASTSRVKAAFGFDATSLTSRGNAGTIATSANAMGTLTGTAYLGNRADGLRALNGRLEEIAVSTRVKGLFDGSTA